VHLAPVLAVFGMATLAIINARRPSLLERGPASYPTPPYPSPPPAGQGVAQPAPRDGRAISALIADEARAQGVDPRVALAFADAESALRPDVQGDLDWPYRSSGALYQKHVLGDPTLSRNPYRGDPSVWHSYGLFQLLAPYHVLELEHPAVLLDPHINAQRGVRAVRTALERSGGELYQARRRYAGCGPGSGCEQNAALVARIDARWGQALHKWGLA
jgi:hypothetical protein